VNSPLGALASRRRVVCEKELAGEDASAPSEPDRCLLVFLIRGCPESVGLFSIADQRIGPMGAPSLQRCPDAVHIVVVFETLEKLANLGALLFV
jgi:hypothetical protein